VARRPVVYLANNATITTKMKIISKERANPINSGEKTHHQERLANPQDAPARPATFRTSNTTNANPNTGKLVVAVAVAELLSAIIL
jgi:hypothetical protein